MTENAREPWAYIAHKGDVWAGSSVARTEDVGEFLAGFAEKGFAITTVYSRDEYDALMKTLS